MPDREDERWQNVKSNLRYCVKHEQWYSANSFCPTCKVAPSEPQQPPAKTWAGEDERPTGRSGVVPKFVSGQRIEKLRQPVAKVCPECRQLTLLPQEGGVYKCFSSQCLSQLLSKQNLRNSRVLRGYGRWLAALMGILVIVCGVLFFPQFSAILESAGLGNREFLGSIELPLEAYGLVLFIVSFIARRRGKAILGVSALFAITIIGLYGFHTPTVREAVVAKLGSWSARITSQPNIDQQISTAPTQLSVSPNYFPTYCHAVLCPGGAKLSNTGFYSCNSKLYNARFHQWCTKLSNSRRVYPRRNCHSYPTGHVFGTGVADIDHTFPYT